MKSFSYKLFFLLFAIMLGAKAAAAKPLEVCNNSQQKAWFGYASWQGANKWQSRGWWEVTAGNCKSIEMGNVSGDVYVFGYDNGGRLGGLYWGGNTPFCTSGTSFEINDSNTFPCAADRFKSYALAIKEADGKYRWNISNDNVISSHYKLCNQSGQKVWYATAQLKGATDNWKSQAWWSLENGACRDVRVHRGDDAYHPTVNNDAGFHVFAYTDDRRLVWREGKYSFCFSRDGQTAFDNSDNMACTEADRGKSSFVTLPVRAGFQTYTFQPSNASKWKTYVNYCNRTGLKVFFANAVYREKWRAVGWWTVDPNQCRELEIVGDQKNGAFYNFGYTGKIYYTANSQGWTQVWAQDEGMPFCVNSSNFDYGQHECAAEGSKYYNFQEHTVAPGVQEVTFSDANAKARTILNLCNDNDFRIYATYAGHVAPNASSKSSHGYYAIEPNACREVTVWRSNNVFANGEFLFYAYDYFKSKWTWGASDKEMCIHSTKSFDYDSQDTKSCDVGGEVRVKTMPVNVRYGRNDIRFSPSNANKRTEIEFCNQTNTDILIYDVTKITRKGPDLDVAGMRATRRGTLAPGACDKKIVVDYNGHPYSGEYYYFAASTDKARWSGDYRFCLTGTPADTGCADSQKNGFRYLTSVRSGSEHKITLDMKNADATKYRFCNTTQQTISAAVAYDYKGNTVSLGLGSLTAGSCVTKDIKNAEGLPVYGEIFLYAKGADGTVYTQGNKTACISTVADQLVTTQPNAACGPNQRSASLQNAKADPSKTNEIKFDESNAVGKSELNFCNESRAELKVAYAWYKDANEGFIAQGWVHLNPLDCLPVRLDPDADQPYEGNVLVFAESSDMKTHGQGPLRFCVNTLNDSWSIPQADRAECRNRNLKRVDASLFQLNAGDIRTIRITDEGISDELPDIPPAPPI